MKQEGEIKLEVNGKEYLLTFNLNVMQAIQSKYTTVGKWSELVDITTEHPEPDIEALIFGFTEMLNEGIETQNDDDGKNRPLLNHRQVGRLITKLGFAKAGATIAQAMTKATDTGNDSKNE